MSADRFIETTGDSVEQAIASGLAELGVGPTDVIVEVLEEPSRGMFGLGARPARVRLQLLNRPSPPVAAPPAQQPKAVSAAPTDEDEWGEGDETLEEDAEVARVVLNEILEKLSIRASVAVRRAEEESESDEEVPWLLNVTSSTDLSPLIGRRGETLSALQYITRLITSRELQRRANIVIDIDGYKSRRTSKLFELAERMANQAIEQQRTVTLEPMPPYERRIIHLALRNREDVTTRSVGEGESRKVTIVPN
jgi:spoIIIJ-associated protein